MLFCRSNVGFCEYVHILSMVFSLNIISIFYKYFVYMVIVVTFIIS